MNHRDFRLLLAALTGSALITIGFLALATVVFGKVVVFILAGLLVGLVLLGIASDVRRAFQTTKQTRFPLAPDPRKSRIRRDDGWRL